MTGQKSSADGVVWNFEGMYSSLEDPNIKKDLDLADEMAGEFEKKYRDIIGPNITPQQAADSLKELEGISRQLRKTLYYAHLQFAKNTTAHETGALKQMAEERYTKIKSKLVFYDLAWCDLDDGVAERIINSPEVTRFRHYIEVIRMQKPHKLSESEEKLWDALELTSRVAFVRLFDQNMGRMVVNVKIGAETKDMSLDAALMLLREPDRETRKAAHAAVTEALKNDMHLLTYIFNTLVQHHATADEFRHFPHPMRQRNLDNEVDDDTVQSLLDCVDKNIGLVARYYRLKARMTGISDLKDYDRYAPLAEESDSCTYSEAKKMVLEAYDSFSPRSSEIAAKFFENNWIDAELKQGKEGGAFSASTTSEHHPYILLNFTDNLSDAMTLAHEMGHGIHQYLAMKQGDLLMNTSLVTAETASVFGEMILFTKLLESEQDPKKRLGRLCCKIEDTFATVFRQVMMNRFETRLHETRRSQGELSADDFHKIWLEENQWMFGDSVEMTEEYSTWWSYVLHFVHYPFYTYAYSFGELMVLALFEQYQKIGEPFVDKYLDMLASGGSDYPRNLMKQMGMDITDPEFWQGGMDLIERMISQAEEDAKTQGL